MRLFHISILILVTILQACSPKEQENLTKYVNPFIGTTAGGNVHPGATLPFAMLNVTPHTETLDWPNMGYNYADSSFVGFVHNQLSGIGNSEFGNFLVTPSNKLNPKKLPNFGIRSKREQEIAEPGYYKIELSDFNILAEVTAEERVGYHRYTFSDAKKGDTLWIVINLARASHPQKMTAAEINWNQDNQLFEAEATYSGGFGSFPTDYSAFAAFKPNQKPDLIRTWSSDKIFKTTSIQTKTGEHCGGILGFIANENTPKIELKVAISYKNKENAIAYLNNSNANFDDVKSQANKTWNTLLNRFQVKGGSEDQKTLFYTSLYRLHLMPTDITGETIYRKQISERSFTNYFAIWDTFRAPHPFFTLFTPSLQRDMLNSLTDIAKEYKWLPDGYSGKAFTKMQGGTNTDVLFADAWVKQLDGVDFKSALPFLLKNARSPSPDKTDGSAVRGRYQEYLKNGWLSADNQWASVSKSLEYAYNDYCVWVVANGLEPKNDYSDIKDRAFSIFELFDDESGFFRPKLANGNWFTPFDPAYSPTYWTYQLHFYEGTAWQYLGYVPHAFPTLISKLGGDSAFVKKWDIQFENRHTRGFFTIENEPDMMAPYQYIYAGRPDKVQEIIPEILSDDFKASPNGWPGNDDSGTLSAWYVFSALGFYPNPGQDWYFIGTPMFDEIILSLENGNEIKIIAKRTSSEQHYIKSATLNGDPLNHAFLVHNELKDGAILEFEMTNEKTNWGQGIKPPSPSIDN